MSEVDTDSEVVNQTGVSEYITANAMELKQNNAPDPSAPDRKYMPQTNDEAIELLDKGVEEI